MLFTTEKPLKKIYFNLEQKLIKMDNGDAGLNESHRRLQHLQRQESLSEIVQEARQSLQRHREILMENELRIRQFQLGSAERDAEIEVEIQQALQRERIQREREQIQQMESYFRPNREQFLQRPAQEDRERRLEEEREKREFRQERRPSSTE